MKDRVLTLACAAGAFALFYAIFVPKPDSEDTRYSQPTTLERQANGYAAAARWLTGAGVQVESLRQRYDTLDRIRPVKGNLLITTMPHRYLARGDETVDLLRWVESGNTVLVLAAMADTPDWTIAYAGTDVPGAIRQVTGVRFVVPGRAEALTADHDADADEPEGVTEETGDGAQDGDSEQSAGDEKTAAEREAAADEAAQGERDQALAALRPLDEPKQHRFRPNRPHPLFDAVSVVVAESEFPAAQWQAVPPPGGAVLSLAHDVETGRDAFWVRNFGKGRFLISGYGSIFANEQLDQAGNARLLANIVAQSVGEHGRVLFDDQHQGVSDLYDAEAFFADGRLRATLWLLLALWLVWVLGGVRLRPAPPHAPAPRETAFVEATGGLLARVIGPAQAGARLLELFFNDLRRRLGLAEDGRPVWDWLERQSRVPRAELDALRAFEARLASGRRVDLVRLQSLLTSLQGKV